jgi:hypothetical protein
MAQEISPPSGCQNTARISSLEQSVVIFYFADKQAQRKGINRVI